MFRIPGLLILAAAALSAQPVISSGGVMNAASYVPPGLPGSGIARGSIFVIFGSGLGPAELVHAQYPLPSAEGLAGTTVQIDAGGTARPAILLYVSANQVAGILPSQVPAGDAQVTVRYNGQTSEPVPVTVHDSLAGLFTRNEAGSGPAVAQNFESPSSTPLNQLDRAARPGQIVVLYGTGLGPVPFDETRPAQAGDLDVDVKVRVGGALADVLYKGRSSCCAGVDQINIRIPDGVTGCAVPVAVEAAGRISNHATLAIAPEGGACSDPGGLSRDEVERLLSRESARIGRIELRRAAAHERTVNQEPYTLRADLGSAGFDRYDTTQLIAARGLPGTYASIGSCSVIVFTGALNYDEPFRTTPLDAGPSLAVQGPLGGRTLEWADPGYSAVFAWTGLPNVPEEPLFLDPGQYAVGSPVAGAHIGPFTATIQMPQPLDWRNEREVETIRRDAGQTVAWLGGEPSDVVTIRGASIVNGRGAAFFCSERAGRATFTIPPQVLLSLPASNSGPNAVASLGLDLVRSGRFNAPGLDLGYISASSSVGKTVTYE